MNTHQIQSLAEKLPAVRKDFRGVFASNNLPRKPLSGFYIANLDPDTEEGSHWVAFHIDGKKNIYFDSYGFSPCRDSFLTFLRQNGRRYEHNRKRLQHMLSTACGQWCLYFIHRRSQGWSLQEITQAFADQGEMHMKNIVNDHTVNLFVEEIFETDLEVIEPRFVKDQIAKQICKNFS